MGGPFGAIESPPAMLSSHIDANSAYSLVNDVTGKKYMIVDVALRAPDNVLRSEPTIGMFFKYVKQYYENLDNNNDYTTDIGKGLEQYAFWQMDSSLEKKCRDGDVHEDHFNGRKVSKRYSKFNSLLNVGRLRDVSGLQFGQRGGKRGQIVKVKDIDGALATA